MTAFIPLHFMAALPEPVTALVDALAGLPGIGPRSAERIALHIVQAEQGRVQRIAEALIRARAEVRQCSICGALTREDPCPICLDTRREPALLCVVERAVDIFPLEKSGAFKGRYHVLNGRISPLNGVGPEDLRIAPLEARLEKEGIQEVILALPSDVEGDATCHYLVRMFGARVRFSRIAQGLPVGSGLEFADELTLGKALEGRRDFH